MIDNHRRWKTHRRSFVVVWEWPELIRFQSLLWRFVKKSELQLLFDARFTALIPSGGSIEFPASVSRAFDIATCVHLLVH